MFDGRKHKYTYENHNIELWLVYKQFIMSPQESLSYG